MLARSAALLNRYKSVAVQRGIFLSFLYGKYADPLTLAGLQNLEPPNKDADIG